MTHPAILMIVASLSVQDARPQLIERWEPLVYYDFGAAEPRPEFDRILGLIAQYALSADWCIRVRASADTAGPADYNMALTRRRAQGIADRLIAAGVPDDRITLNPTGETRLAHATEDGVPDSLNRLAWVDMFRCEDAS